MQFYLLFKYLKIIDANLNINLAQLRLYYGCNIIFCHNNSTQSSK